MLFWMVGCLEMVVKAVLPRVTGSPARLSVRLSAVRSEDTSGTIYCIYHRHQECPNCLYSTLNQHLKFIFSFLPHNLYLFLRNLRIVIW